MGEKTNISWCDHTFNPWVGCTKVSSGCTYCYAEAHNKRFGKDVWGAGKLRERTSPANWKLPLTWARKAARDNVRRRVFCASMADVFDPEVPDQWRFDLFELIRQCQIAEHYEHDARYARIWPNNEPSDFKGGLDWLLLTKRPDRAADFLQRLDWDSYGHGAWSLRETPQPLHPQAPTPRHGVRVVTIPWITSALWVGTTAEDQQRADERIPHLLRVPAAVRFLSCEPLLERVANDAVVRNLDWLICGGESGGKARPFSLEWARELRDQCSSAGVAFFMKQVGDNASDPVNGLASPRVVVPQEAAALVSRRFVSHHGADPAEWPADLRVQQFPLGVCNE